MSGGPREQGPPVWTGEASSINSCDVCCYCSSMTDQSCRILSSFLLPSNMLMMMAITICISRVIGLLLRFTVNSLNIWGYELVGYFITLHCCYCLMIIPVVVYIISCLHRWLVLIIRIITYIVGHQSLRLSAPGRRTWAALCLDCSNRALRRNEVMGG